MECRGQFLLCGRPGRRADLQFVSSLYFIDPASILGIEGVCQFFRGQYFFLRSAFFIQVINQVTHIQESMEDRNSFRKILKIVVIILTILACNFAVFDSLAQKENLLEYDISLMGIEE